MFFGLQESIKKAIVGKEKAKTVVIRDTTDGKLKRTKVVDGYVFGDGSMGAYRQRFEKPSLSREGGTAKTEKAVTAALRWLRNHQNPEGRRDTDGWQDNCKKSRCMGPGHNEGHSRYDVRMTGVVLLAYLGNGHGHRFGTFKRSVEKGLRWLMKQQKANGSIGFSDGQDMYNHALATLALCEVYAQTLDFKYKKYAQRAVDFCVKAQNEGKGWKYGIKSGHNDSSVTGWMGGRVHATALNALTLEVYYRFVRLEK
jgi:hypothetical protein